MRDVFSVSSGIIDSPKNGLVVAALEEPEPTEEFLADSQQGPWIAEIPLHCVIEAWKVGEAVPGKVGLL